MLLQIWMKRIRFSMSPVKTSKISILKCLDKEIENIYHSTFVGNIIGMNENKLHNRKFSTTCMPYTHSWQWLTGSPSLLIWKVSPVFKSQRVHCVHLYEVPKCTDAVHLYLHCKPVFLRWVHDDNFPLRDWFKQRGFILMYCWLLFVNLLWTLSGSVSVYSPFTTIFCSIWLSGIA